MYVLHCYSLYTKCKHAYQGVASVIDSGKGVRLGVIVLDSGSIHCEKFSLPMSFVNENSC